MKTQFPRRTGPRDSFLRAAWLCGAAMAALLLLGAWLFSDMRFANNDDTYILRAAMGFGAPTDFNMCLHWILFEPLVWLGRAFPGVAWFSWMQLCFLWLSMTVLVKSLLQCFHRAGRPLWQGLLASALFLLVYAMVYCCKITFTVTAALLGAAAVAQILSVDGDRASNGQVTRSLLGSLALAVLAYGLRQVTAAPVLAFCAVAVAVLWLHSFRGGKRSLRPLAIAAAIVAVTFSGLVLLREAEIRQKDVGAYLDWQTQSGRVMDYDHVTSLQPETLDQLGWSESELALINDWYFMEENLTAEAFAKAADALNAQKDQTLGARILRGWQKLIAFCEAESVAARSLAAALALFALGALGLCFSKGARLASATGLCAGVLLGTALLFYLAMRGRLPLRAAMTAVLPAAALGACLLPSCLPAVPARRKAVALRLGALVCVSLCLWYIVPAMRSQAREPVDPFADNVSAYADLDEFAASNPEYLILLDNSLVSDLRMFPSTEYGIPQNILYWGGWGTHSPAYNAQLRAFGFDPERWTARNFLCDNVLLVRGMIDPPPQKLLDYLGQSAPVGYSIDSEYGGVYSFVFYEE